MIQRRMTETRRDIVLAALFCFACATASAAVPNSLEPLLGCRELADAAARLACFDRESAVLAKTEGRAQLAPEQTFGLSQAAIAAKQPAAAQPRVLAEFEARVVKIGYRSDGRAEFALDNGQVWRQLSAGDDLLVEPGSAVKLSRAALGSYRLSTAAGRGCKVTRIR